jgi:hypothetical protein
MGTICSMEIMKTICFSEIIGILRNIELIGTICIMAVFCVHLVIYQQQQQLGLSEARSLAAPWEDRRYCTSWQAVRPAHHSTNQRPSIPLLLWAGQGAVMGHWSTLLPSVVVVVTVGRGRIIGRNRDKSLQSFSSCYSQSPPRQV